MVLMQSRVRDNESTTASIGSMDGGAASGSVAASDFRPRNSTTFCIIQFQIRTASRTDPSGGFHHDEASRRVA
jgi:hypothetical protein